jgi:hypothetical protein
LLHFVGVLESGPDGGEKFLLFMELRGTFLLTDSLFELVYLFLMGELIFFFMGFILAKIPLVGCMLGVSQVEGGGFGRRRLIKIETHEIGVG